MLIKERRGKENKAEISGDEHGFVASVSDYNEHEMKSTSQYIV
jgi:hypothetical protein